MNGLTAFLDYFFSFPAYVMLPLVLLVIALIARMPLEKAFMAVLKLGVGFAGVFIVFDFFVASIGPAVESIALTREFAFPVLDVGWPPLAAITWASPIAPLTIPIFLAINVLMLATRTTQTINLDIWNYWHYALIGSLVMSTTRSFWLGLIATILIGIYSIKMADWNGIFVEKRAGIKGVAITTVSINGLLPYAILLDWLFERIPGFRRLNFNPQESERNGSSGKLVTILSEPMIIGLLVGVFLGILAKYELKELLTLSVHIAAVMFLLPPCGILIGKGIEPISLRLKEVLTKRYGRDHNMRVGMDAGPLLKNRSILVTGLLLMPITLGLAFIIPGNRVLPLGDLPNLISVVAIITLVHRNNVIRSVIAGIPIVITLMLISSKFAELYTDMAADVGFQFEGYDGLITAFTDGGNQVRYLFFYIFQGNFVALSIIPIVLVLMFITRKTSRNLEQSQATPEVAE
jgi:PTS system galactitol-specific IIC component